MAMFNSYVSLPEGTQLNVITLCFLIPEAGSAAMWATVDVTEVSTWHSYRVMLQDV